MTVEPVIRDDLAGLRAKGGERALGVSTPSSPGGCPDRLGDPAHAGRWSYRRVEGQHTLAILIDLPTGHAGGPVLMDSRSIRIFSGLGGHYHGASIAENVTNRAYDGVSPAINPADTPH